MATVVWDDKAGECSEKRTHSPKLSDRYRSPMLFLIPAPTLSQRLLIPILILWLRVGGMPIFLYLLCSSFTVKFYYLCLFNQ